MSVEFPQDVLEAVKLENAFMERYGIENFNRFQKFLNEFVKQVNIDHTVSNLHVVSDIGTEFMIYKYNDKED